jgi:hypothetical protein
MVIRLIAVFAALMLSSCTTNLGIVAAADDKRCIERGFTPDTEDFASCLKRLAAQRSDFMEKGRLDTLNPQDVPAQEPAPQ